MRDLRLREDDPRDHSVRRRLLTPEGVVRGEPSLIGGHVSERQRARDVAGRKDAAHRGAQVGIDDDPVLLHAHTHLVEAKAVDVRDPAGGNEELIAAQRAFTARVSHREFDIAAASRGPQRLRPEVQANPV